MNQEDYERAMDAQWAATHADQAFYERGFPLADLVEPEPPDFLSDLLARYERT